MYQDPALKKLHMRSWRRGMKEMDLIFGNFADMGLTALNAAQLAQYEALLGENDQEIYAWFCGFEPTPVAHQAILSHIKSTSSVK